MRRLLAGVAIVVVLGGCSDSSEPELSDELQEMSDAVAAMPDCSEWVGATIEEVDEDTFTNGCLDGDTIYAGSFGVQCVTYNGYLARVDDGELVLATSDEAMEMASDC